MSAEKLRIGFIPLADAAALIVAVDKGFAAREDLDIELVREVSWSNIRDKLNIGLFDAAHLLAPVAIASSLGLGHVRVPIIVPYNLSLNGNAITVTTDLYKALADKAQGDLADPLVSARALAAVVQARTRAGREPLTFGISTDGAAPVFAKAIRAKLEALIPHSFARWAEAARQWRARLQTSGLPFEGRRRFWERFTDRAITDPNRKPVEADFSALVTETKGMAGAWQTGSVALVGAGPGDPELLTLRAVRALQAADVILFDDLVPPAILDFARREAKKLLVGKTGHGPSCKQDEINALMITFARQGRRVVRLKGGDPMIFSRGGEEIDACRRAGIAVEVVPGITAAQGAASRLKVSLTHREHARRVQFITGHDRGGRLPADIDWASLADPKVTTVVYMPTRTFTELAAKAIAGGLDSATPAVAVVRATRTDEVRIAGNLAQLGPRLEAEASAGPVLVMIGWVFAELMTHRQGSRVRSP